MTDQDKFINHISKNYDTLKRKFTRACRDLQLTLTDDLYQDTILKCYESIQRKGKLNDTTEYGMECYFFQSLKMNAKRETQYARNLKRDGNINSDNIHTLYEDWYNENMTSTRIKLLNDLYADFAVLYICKMVEINFDEEHFYLFRVKYLVPEMTYKKLAETSKLKKVRQKVAEVKQWLKDNVSQEDIKREFWDIYGSLFDD